jgi:hypothetical protein
VAILNIGNEAVDSEELAYKVEADIDFLYGRLMFLQQQNNPNQTIIETYQDMLESRQALHAWLLQEDRKVSNG